MTKKELRKIFIEKRLALTEAEYQQRNYQLCEHFFAGSDLSFIKILHTFIPLEKNKEPNTWLIIDRIRREYPHIRLAVPKVNPENSEIENYFFEGLHQLKPNAWDILEPHQGVPVEASRIQMALVPLLAVDREGHRVGYGKGFYDKFLGVCGENTRKVGLSLFEPVEKISDINANDVRLDACITPTGMITFK